MSQEGRRTYDDYLIGLEGESPCYVFEFAGGELEEAFCEACANDDVDLFLPEEEFDMLAVSES